MMIALIEKTLGLLVDILLAGVVQLEKRFAPMRVSKTGDENPRTRHLLGALGHSSHAYHSTAPNIHKWLKEQDDLFPIMFDVNNRSGTVRGFEKMVIARSALYRMVKRLFWRRAYSGLCPYVFSMAHILQNGDMPMCANDWQNREVLGNVREKSIREIYNSPRMKEIRELILQGRYEEIEPCRSCSFYHEMIKAFDKGRIASPHLTHSPAGSET